MRQVVSDSRVETRKSEPFQVYCLVEGERHLTYVIKLLYVGFDSATVLLRAYVEVKDRPPSAWKVCEDEIIERNGPVLVGRGAAKPCVKGVEVVRE